MITIKKLSKSYKDNSNNHTVFENVSYEFKAKETRTITIKPGSYSIHASSTGVRPYIGKIKLEGGKKYFRRYYVYTVSK